MKSMNVVILGAVVGVVCSAVYLALHPPAPPGRPLRGGNGANAQHSLERLRADHSTKLGIPTAPSPSASRQDSEISETVRTIVDLQEDCLKRYASVRALTFAPTTAERRSLFGFLRQRNKGDDHQQEQVLKNDLLDVLCEHSPPPPGLCDTLVQVYRDPQQHIVLRDYAVQHLVSYYDNIVPFSTSTVLPFLGTEEETIRQVLQKALKEVNSSIAGTALLGLSLLAQDHPGFDRQQIAAAALELAGEGSAGELTRITALQVCARLGLKEALPVVSQVAKGGKTLSLRISAVAALGALGGVEVKPFLQDLLDGAEERLKLPARNALNRIQQREVLAVKTETRG